MTRDPRGIGPLGGNPSNNTHPAMVRAGQQASSQGEDLGPGLKRVGGKLMLDLASGALAFTAAGQLEWQAGDGLSQGSPAFVDYDSATVEVNKSGKLGVKKQPVMVGDGLLVDVVGRPALAVDGTTLELEDTPAGRVVKAVAPTLLTKVATLDPATVTDPPTQAQVVAAYNSINSILGLLAGFRMET